jgi:hypothetical protein
MLIANSLARVSAARICQTGYRMFIFWVLPFVTKFTASSYPMATPCGEPSPDPPANVWHTPPSQRITDYNLEKGSALKSTI